MPSGLDGHPNPISTEARSVVLGLVVDEVVRRQATSQILLVGIDGIDGAGKSTFADELAMRLADQVLVFDGIFVQRPELREYWDVVVYLDGRHRVEQGRLARLLAERPDDPDGATEYTWAAARAIHRSSSAMDWYDALADPESNATFVIDNNDLAAPTIRSTPSGRDGPEPG